MIEGRYVRESNSDSAELNVSLAEGDRVRVAGLALWGRTNPHGPNVGQIDFEARLHLNKVVFRDDQYPQGPYTLALTFTETGATAEEQAAPGYFGVNVSFAGEYRRV